jgi:hypothetical protein
MSDRVKLPGQRNSPTPAPTPFPVGAAVVLRSCPDATPGTVMGTRRGKIRVRWEDLNLTTMHRHAALVPVADGMAVDGPQLTQDTSAANR